MAHISEAGVKKIREICARYTNEKTPLMMILSDIQNEYGYIPLEVQQLVSEITGISVADIYGVVTFYSFFSLEPKGKYVISSLRFWASNPARPPRTVCSPSMHCAASVPAASHPQCPSTVRSIPR